MPSGSKTSPADYSQDTLSVSSRSTASSFAAHFGERDFLQDPSSAYILLDFARMAWSAGACSALRAYDGVQGSGLQAGARYLVHQFDNDHLHRLKGFFLEANHFPRHEGLPIVVDLDEDANLLVQEYHGRNHLTTLDPQDACLTMTQLLAAIHALHSERRWHGHIRPEFLIQSAVEREFSIQLDGLWYWRIFSSERRQEPEHLQARDLKELGHCVLFLLRANAAEEHDGSIESLTELFSPMTARDKPIVQDPMLFDVLCDCLGASLCPRPGGPGSSI